ncbi:unnamed protein product, partial [Ectocarpus sp. 12 AP-2014]
RWWGRRGCPSASGWAPSSRWDRTCLIPSRPPRRRSSPRRVLQLPCPVQLMLVLVLVLVAAVERQSLRRLLLPGGASLALLRPKRRRQGAMAEGAQARPLAAAAPVVPVREDPTA